MRLPKTTKSRVWLAIGAITALAVIAFGITAFNLWQDGNDPSASSSKDGKDAIPAGPTDYPTFAGPSVPAGDAASALGGGLFGKTAGSKDPFGTGASDNRLHTVKITISSDGAAYLGYRYRDGKNSDIKVINRSFTYTRTVNGPLPLVQVAVQVLRSATYATCSVAIDGTTTDSATARGTNHVVVCLS